MQINEQAPLTARMAILVQAPPEVVWRVHTNIDGWSRWHPGITSASLEGPLTKGSVFQWKSGGTAITSTIQLVEPNRQIGWTGKTLGAHAIHIWSFEPHQVGTMLTTEESMEGWLVRILKVLMPDSLDDSLRTWLQSLKREAEGKDTATSC